MNVLSPLVYSEEWLASFHKDNDVQEFLELLRFQGWLKVGPSPAVVDKEQVKAFYKDLRYKSKDGSLHFKIDGEKASVNERQVRGFMGLSPQKPPSDALSSLPEGGFETTDEELPLVEHIFQGKRPIGLHRVAHVLSKVGAIAHYFICRAVLPRQEKRSIVQTHDIILIDAFLERRPINLARIAMQHMAKCGRKRHALPYPGLVKLILDTERL